VKAKNVILATGSEAKMLPGLSADDRILTNIEILAIDQVPKSLIVIGAGAVGMEFSSIFRSFGTEVTILEFLPRVVPVEDEEISKEITRLFKKRGIDVNTGAKVEKVEKTEAGVKVSLHRRQRQAAGEGSRKSTSGRRPRRDARKTSAWRRQRSSSNADSSRSTKLRRPPSRASLPSATSSSGCRNWPTWAR
jgi:dihydrolipoamide dehydrogenase